MNENQRKKLPIGIQTFSSIREGNYYYVDKTNFAVDLADSYKYYFLSRPRRFGKSLFLDTLKELFEGNQSLFLGLAAEKRWDWAKKHPVIRISFGGGVFKSRVELEQGIHKNLSYYESHFHLPPRYSDNRSRFSDLIERLYQQTGQGVVVLVDEYDKPILDSIETDVIALEVRECLKDLYAVLKDCDRYLRFVFLTGISKFSKVNLFSGLNNLKDITLSARYSAICGYTDADVDLVFEAELFDVDRVELRRWYNGYNWLGEGVYNPFDLLLFFDEREFNSYWFETGSPEFLVKILSQRQFFTPDLNETIASAALLSTFDVGNMPLKALLFQTGYLTIKKREKTLDGDYVFTLTYPNIEVQKSLNSALLPYYGVDADSGFEGRLSLSKVLRSNRLDELKNLFHALFASIPHSWYAKNDISTFEGFYASVFYSHFAALGFDITTETSTNHGRMDMVVRLAGRIYIFEFKVVKEDTEGTALQQIKDKKYAERYQAENQPIHLIGVEFSKRDRNIIGFQVETIDV